MANVDVSIVPLSEGLSHHIHHVACRHKYPHVSSYVFVSFHHLLTVHECTRAFIHCRPTTRGQLQKYTMCGFRSVFCTYAAAVNEQDEIKARLGKKKKKTHVTNFWNA